MRPLFDRIIKGDRDAGKRMIEGHMRLALSIAARYSFFGANFEETSSAALLGICDAVSRIWKGEVIFDNITGYIIRYIHQYCSESVRKDTLVPMPRGKKPAEIVTITDTVAIYDVSISEMVDTLESIIKTPEEQKVVDYRAQGMTDQETADKMEVNRSKVTRIRLSLFRRYRDVCN